MSAELKNTITATDERAKYDACAKRLLGNKDILAHILVKTVDEFQGMAPKDVIPLIEGEPYIGTVPAELGLTNAVYALPAGHEKAGKRIVGLNTEHGEINEGDAVFDIICYVRLKDGLSQVIINVEVQKDEPTSYYLLNRAVFYISRMVSSQKERDFKNSNYNDIKRVFSIWICMNMSENSLDYVHLTNDTLLGNKKWKGGLDLLNIVLIGISSKLPERNEEYRLHRLLSALLSDTLSVEEKLNIMEAEYDIKVQDDMRRDVDVMCNLGQGVLERGMKLGIAQGIEIGKENGIEDVIFNMHINGFTTEQITLATNKTGDEVNDVIRKKKLVMA